MPYVSTMWNGEKMKFLYTCDLHGKMKNPNNRLDNFSNSWVEKIKEIAIVSKKEKCKFIAMNGDIFDTPNVSNVLIDEFIDIFEENNIALQVTWGNHDLVGHNKSVSKASALAHIFRRSKSIKELTEIENDSVYIKGYDYNHDIENELIEKGLTHNKKDKFTIAIPHAFISIKPFFKQVVHVCAKDLKTNYDLVLCSHFHIAFDETINGTRFINPNSIGRTSIREQHTPAVLIVDTATRKIEKIELKSAKPAAEVFDLTKYEEKKENEKTIDDFIASLNNYQWQSIDMRTQIKTIGKEQKVETKVIDYLMGIIERGNNGGNQ